MEKLLKSGYYTYTDKAKEISREVSQALKPIIKKYSDIEEWNPIVIEHIILSEVWTLLSEAQLQAQVSLHKKVREVRQWQIFGGEYEKEWYDIKLKTGEIVHQCWPNAGNFHAPSGIQYSGRTVREIRLCKHPLEYETIKQFKVLRKKGEI